VIHRTKVDLQRVAQRIARLKEIPERVEGIKLIVLFGSLAQQATHPLSDVDLAFEVDDLDDKKRVAVLGEVIETLGTDEVDIVFLNDDLPYRLKYDIAEDGHLVYEHKPGAFGDFQVNAIAMWLDFKPYADYQSRAFRERIEKHGFGA
jgi:predicted nucleotidyltransferase